MCQPAVRYERVSEKQFFKFQEACQVRKSAVGNRRVGQIKNLNAGKIAEVSQPFISDVGAEQPKFLELLQTSQSRQSGVGKLSMVVQAEVFQAIELFQVFKAGTGQLSLIDS